MMVGLAGTMMMLFAAPDAAATPPAAAEAAAPAVPQDSPEEIAKDAARDLKDSRFYNKPGATRAQYDAAWQECRLIARGTRTPSGTYTTIYNPNVISPAMAGAASGLGAAIGQAIVEGQLRRANRRTCLMIRGWRLVEVPDAERVRLAALPDADRDRFFDSIVGATDLGGRKVTIWDNRFAAPPLAVEARQ